MENLWQDPLLFTDVSWQKPHLETMEMEKTGSPLCDNVIQSYYLESSSHEMMNFLSILAFGVWVEDNFHLGFLIFFQDFERHLSL